MKQTNKLLISPFITMGVFLILVVSIANAQNSHIRSGTIQGPYKSIEPFYGMNPTLGINQEKVASGDLQQSSLETNIPDIIKEFIKVYPNPILGDAVLTFYAKEAGFIKVSINDVSGKVITSTISNTVEGIQTYQISGLNQGLYILSITGENYTYSAKIVSQNTNFNEARISYLGSENSQTNSNGLSSNDGMHFKNTSGNTRDIMSPLSNDKITILKGTDNDSGNPKLPLWVCGNTLTISHSAGSVAPVSKTVAYGTITNIPGASQKCWITSNLGASHQATSVSDATEASGGWYWQFNRKQGYMHNGLGRIPNTTWIININENMNWAPSTDPCKIELGEGWRIPTMTEWSSVGYSGNWTTWTEPWNSGLKLHAAGHLMYNSGSLSSRGTFGDYWSSTQYTTTEGLSLRLGSMDCSRYIGSKSYGFSVRCLKDPCSGGLPTVTTTSVSNIGMTTATSGGNVTNNGGATVTERGVCWSISQTPTIIDNHTSDGSGTGSYVSNLTGLDLNTHYYVRAYATNCAGTAYGSQVDFTTLGGSDACMGIATVLYEGKTYNTVAIGTQCWLEENLNVGIRLDSTQSQNSSNGIKEKFCYRDLESNCAIYGGLYQWNEAMQGSFTPGAQGICPSGWHIPTDLEYTTLTTFLGGEAVAGGKMKTTGTMQAGTGLWDDPNTGATNSSGFSGVPTGQFNMAGNTYIWMHINTSLLTSSYTDVLSSWIRVLYFESEGVYRGCCSSGSIYNGGSVRCLKN